MPVVGHDAHLPALDDSRLSPAGIIRALADGPSVAPVLRGDGGLVDPQATLKPAAVLVPLVRQPAGLTVLLTQRTSHLRAHAGQISFPGGRLEPGDAGAEACALREASEEVGLDPSCAEVVGRMGSYLTVTGFEVTPVVAFLESPLDLRPDPHEVADIFEVPLAFLMDPSNHRRHRVELPERTRHFLSMPWRGRGWSGQEREYFIWGATAAMLRNLYHLLARPS